MFCFWNFLNFSFIAYKAVIIRLFNRSYNNNIKFKFNQKIQMESKKQTNNKGESKKDNKKS